MADAHSSSEPVALVSARALGDGLLTLTLAENLRRAGRDATLYHSQLLELQSWAPTATLRPLPEGEALDALLRDAPALFLGDPSLGSPEARAAQGRTEHLVFTKALWSRTEPYLQSLGRAASGAYGLEHWDFGNGLIPPDPTQRGANARRVCLHPTSARAVKNWPASSFLELAGRLQADGYEPVFLLAENEEAEWRMSAGDAYPCVVPGRLDAVAAYLHASAAAITTDSGIGHLASAVGVPTLSLFRKRSAARFWAPCWGSVRAVTAPVRLPGKSGHRHWGRLLSASRVQRAFQLLLSEA